MKAKLSWSGWLAGAAMLAALTLTAPPRASAQDIHVRMSASGMPEFMFGGEPRLALVPNTTVYYVSDFDDADVYRVSGTWYALYHGTWYRSDAGVSRTTSKPPRRCGANRRVVVTMSD